MADRIGNSVDGFWSVDRDAAGTIVLGVEFDNGSTMDRTAAAFRPDAISEQGDEQCGS
jgi:hypothetical protein